MRRSYVAYFISVYRPYRNPVGRLVRRKTSEVWSELGGTLVKRERVRVVRTWPVLGLLVVYPLGHFILMSGGGHAVFWRISYSLAP